MYLDVPFHNVALCRAREDEHDESGKRRPSEQGVEEESGHGNLYDGGEDKVDAADGVLHYKGRVSATKFKVDPAQTHLAWYPTP